MAPYRFARFEVDNRRDLLRTAAGALILVGLGEPLLSGLVRTLPRRSSHVVLGGWAELTTRFLEIEFEVRGLEHVDPSQPYVVAPLHEGFADALALARLPLRLRYVARDELFEWPQLGRFLRASGQILVNPESPLESLRGLLDECTRAFARGESVVVFPQGSILGIEAAFTSGAFRVADRLDRPVLPVVLTGSHRVWEHPYSDRLRFGQTVSMVVLPPVPTGEAVDSMRQVETEMKRIALAEDTAPPRRFDPRRDGYWDGYRYEIDPAFPEIADLVARHRRSRS